MIDLNEIYTNRYQLKAHQELLFEKPVFTTGLMNPFLFMVDKKYSLIASHYTVSSVEDIGYDIHVVTSDQQVLLYLIDIKHPYVTQVLNGIIVRSKTITPVEDISDGINIRYSMEHFQVISNRTQTCTIFGRNMTTDPKT